MALTLTEASKLSNDVLMQGVVETIIKDSPVLQNLPFIEIAGNGLTYKPMNTPAPAARAASCCGLFVTGAWWPTGNRDTSFGGTREPRRPVSRTCSP